MMYMNVINEKTDARKKGLRMVVSGVEVRGGVVTRMIIHYSLNGEKGTKILDIEDGMELKEPEEIK